ncbi:MAG: RNA ligase [Methanothrix sp.]
MNLSRAARSLGVPVERLESLMDGILKLSSWPEPRLLRFEKGISGVEPGTVIFENGDVVHGYPKIRRAMMLGPAIRRNFLDRVAVEEKMNGYNIRAVSIDGDVYALTRGGYLCPFSTEVVRERIDPDLFEDHPDIVLCGEMVGPENPYVPKDVYPVESIDFYLFDISKKNCRSMMGVHATHALAEEYGVNVVPFFGEFPVDRAAEEIFRIIKRLGRAGREGVVIKDPENRASPLKYTASESNCSDLEFAFRYYNDYAQDFFLSRVVREGFQSVEWNEDEAALRERALRLGESILVPLTDTIRRRMQGEQIMQQVQIRVRSIQTARDFEQHLRRMGTKAIFDIPEQDGDSYVVRILKQVMSTNDKTLAVIEGQPW